MRVVPILRDVEKGKNKFEARYEPRTSTITVPIQIRRERENNLNPFLVDIDNPSELVTNQVNASHTMPVQTADTPAPLATEDACYACDACTQTDHRDKKDGCDVM